MFTFISGPLGLYELVDKIYASLLEEVFEGIELHANKDGNVAPCKILKILDSGGTKMCEVGWIRKGKAITNTSVIKAADLFYRRAPVSRNTLKFFIRDATSQSNPWVIHENLAKKFGITIEPPDSVMVSIPHFVSHVCYKPAAVNYISFSIIMNICRRKGEKDKRMKLLKMEGKSSRQVIQLNLNRL